MKRVLVWGMAKSGIAAAKLLCDAGVFVRINDLKSYEELKDDLKPLENCNYENRLGEDVMTLIDDIDTMIISPGIPADHKAAVAAREKGVEVISEIELAYRFTKGLIVGVTGTNGKTTTTTLIGEIFKNLGKDTHVVGNIGEPYSLHAMKTTPESVTVCELSSFQLETIKNFKPDISLILNLTEDHLNRHKTMENYARIKERVFSNQTSNETLILNYDDEITRKMAQDAHCKVIWFSTKEPVHGIYAQGSSILWNDGTTECKLMNVGEIYIPGQHNLENALAAAAAALTAGVPADTVTYTLKTFKGVEHRIEFVRTVDGISYINDSKGTNPDSTIKAVNCMKVPTVIMLGGSEKNSDYSEMAKVIKNSNVRYAVLLGDTGMAIGKALEAAGFDQMEYTGYDFRKSIECACAHAAEGWNVLLSPACASFDMFKDFEQRGEVFKSIVNGF